MQCNAMGSSLQILLASSTITFLVTLISLTVGQQVEVEQPLYHWCIDNGNFTGNSSYETNLNRLVSSFSSSNLAANDYGFYRISSGPEAEASYGVALCRGDVNSGDCLSCINNSTIELRSRCPNYKEAIIWYDSCMFHYANRSLFGVMETHPGFYMSEPNNVTDGDAFNSALGALMSRLESNASVGTSLSKFATGNQQVTPSQTIYGLVQCNPDLDTIQCSSCLSQTIRQIPDCCDRKQGGRGIGPSCNFRFDIERFYGLTPADVPSPPSPPPPSPPSPPPPSNNVTSTTATTDKKSDSSRHIIIITVSAVAFALLLISTCIFFFLRVRKSKLKTGTARIGTDDEIGSPESLQFDFNTIANATNYFSDANKIGQGGFGAVYKGTLENGELIAVKRLSADSGQGDQEFKNEVQLVAQLQHKNLVTLRGFCLERSERLLVYEFVPNASLDQFLFDPVKRASLDWERRYKIIGGIARGLLYLHEDSRLRIIHRDLKASNILLDAEMNPKIADFGMARLFAVDQTQGATSRIVGTYGYMAPEYAMHGQFSVKSDVFSFGVLLLEILSGQKNNAFHNGENVEDLLSYAWRSWKERTALELVDPALREGSRTELLRCIHIGLLCVQDNVAGRPNMASVVLMLTSDSITLSLPSQPAFFMDSNTRSRDDMSWSWTSQGQDLISKATESSQSKNEVAAAAFSENEVSITELYPR